MKEKILYSLIVINLLATIFLCFSYFKNKLIKQDYSDEILKVRGLVVVDSVGVERVIIGSPLPDPAFLGYRIPRGGNSISGILLIDSEGQERSGYVTDDNYGNVFLTLDSKTRQNALFIAEPQGAASLMLWSENRNSVSFVAANDTVLADIINHGNKLDFCNND